MAENIRIYPGRHFTIDEISGVYFNYFSPTEIDWQTVSTRGHEDTKKLSKDSESKTDTSITFFRKVTPEFTAELPFFNVIAVFNETEVDGITNYELLTYGLLGTIQNTDSTNQWNVNIQLEWNSDIQSTIISLLRVYLTHTKDSSATSLDATETIDKVHEKLLGLGSQVIDNRSQRIAFYYDNRTSNNIDGASAGEYTKYADAGKRLTNNNLLFLSNTSTGFSLGNVAGTTVDTTSDISNGGLVIKARGGATNYLDDVTTYYLDSTRASYIPDVILTPSETEKVSKNEGATGSTSETRYKAISDFTACTIGNYIFPQLAKLIYDDSSGESGLSEGAFLEIFLKSYRKATLSFNLARGMNFFLPIDDLKDTFGYRYFIVFPGGTNDFLVKILKIKKPENFQISDTIFMPILYIQQGSYYIQYENGKGLKVNIPTDSIKQPFAKNTDYETLKSNPQTLIEIPSNPWCFPKKTGNEWVKTNDLPEVYYYTIIQINEIYEYSGFITPNTNAVGLIGSIVEKAPVDIKGLLRYYNIILDKVKESVIGKTGTVTLTPFDGISYKILEKMEKDDKIEWEGVSSGDEAYKTYVAIDSISIRFNSVISSWDSKWELTESELYELYAKTYDYKNLDDHGGADNISWLTHFYDSIKSGLQNALVYKSLLDENVEAVISAPLPISTLDWDSLSVVGNEKIELLQFDVIQQGFTRAAEAIKNTFNYFIASNSSDSVKWMFFDNAVVLVDKRVSEESQIDNYYYITVMKYSDKYGASLFRQIIPSSKIENLQVTYSSDILTLKFDYKDEMNNITSYSTLYDLNLQNPHKPVASTTSVYSYDVITMGITTINDISMRDIYYSNGILFETEDRTSEYKRPLLLRRQQLLEEISNLEAEKEATADPDERAAIEAQIEEKQAEVTQIETDLRVTLFYYYLYENVQDRQIWYRSNGIRLMRKIFKDLR